VKKDRIEEEQVDRSYGKSDDQMRGKGECIRALVLFATCSLSSTPLFRIAKRSKIKDKSVFKKM
jgi:hypothetical protein